MPLKPKSFGAVKAHGVICVFDGCYKIMRTQKWQEHFTVHLPEGEDVTVVHRRQYERALLDARLLDLVPESAVKAVMAASMVRISHTLVEICDRLRALDVPPATAPLQATRAAPAAEPPVEPTLQEEATVAESAVDTSDHGEEEAEEEDEQATLPPPAKSSKRAARPGTKASGTKTRKKSRRS